VVRKTVPATPVAEKPFSFDDVKPVKGGTITVTSKPGRARTPSALEAQYIASRGDVGEQKGIPFTGVTLTLPIPDSHKEQAIKELLKSATYFGDGRPDLDATQPDKIVFRAHAKRAIGRGAASR